MLRTLLVAAIAAAAIVAAPTASADPYDQLRAMLPTGYGPDSCRPGEGGYPSSTELAALECRDNSLPGGPTYAYYRLYADHDVLNDAFSTEREGSRQMYWWFEPCPGWGANAPAQPMTWYRESNPNESAGWVVCGRTNGPAHGNAAAKSIIWTTDSDLLLSIGEGPDLARLYDWWKQIR